MLLIKIFKPLFTKFFQPLLSAFLIACMLLFVKFLIKPARPAVSWSRRKAAEIVAEHLVDEIRKSRGNGRTAVILHLDNDPTHCITTLLREHVEATGILTVTKPSIVERIQIHFGWPVEVCQNKDEALRIAYDSPQDLLIWGTVDRFETDGAGKALLTGTLYVIDVNTMTIVLTYEFGKQPVAINSDPTDTETYSQTITTQQPPRGTVDPPTKPSLSFPTRLAIFLSLAFLPPLLAFQVLRDIVAKRSNSINLILLLVLTFFDTILATAILGTLLNPIPLPWFMACAAMLSVFCNLMLLSHAARLES